METTPWLRFEVSEQAYAIPLASVVEVTGAARPHLIPRIPLEIGGVPISVLAAREDFEDSAERLGEILQAFN